MHAQPQARDPAHDRAYNVKRDPRLASMRGGKRWQTVRARKLASDPACEHCLSFGIVTPAQQIHHVRDAAMHHDLFFDPRNLESVCTACHAHEERRRRATARKVTR